MKHLTIIAGTRPNFVKIAPLVKQLEKHIQQGEPIAYTLVHTGQHFSKEMSADFFEQLGIPEPQVTLSIDGRSHAEQTAAIMVQFERHLLSNATDLVIVVGDVTSTMACALAAKKLNIKVAHIEAGIRSFDRTMPEEINRLVTDSITDYFFTTSSFANAQLKKEGINPKNIFFVGNIMIDTLLANKNKFVKPDVWNTLQLKNKGYIVLTLHRPANVDDVENLKKILTRIQATSRNVPILFPAHPRTENKLRELDFDLKNIVLLKPLPYLEFNYLVAQAQVVITDSGGITEETTVLGVPCLTVRDNTERPETVTQGTNELVGADAHKLAECLDLIVENKWKCGKRPRLWDGKTAERIVKKIIQLITDN